MNGGINALVHPCARGLARASASVFAAAVFLLVGPASSAFADGAPLVLSSNSEKVETTQANLKARVDANGAAASYYFEYTTEASFEADEFNGASRIPLEGEKALGLKNQNASAHIDGLQPASTYRFRVVASNEHGSTSGPPRLLTTDEKAPKFALPDSRGWEMVSPAEKNGGQVDRPEADYGGGDFQASADGDGVTYSSLDSFGVPLGSPGASQYLSLRGTAGWTTENLTVLQYSGGYDTAPGAGSPYKLFSEDLSAGLSTNGRRCRGEGTGCPVPNLPLPDSGAPNGFRNFYLRDSGNGSYTALVTGADVGESTLGSDKFEVSFVAATPDLSQIVLSTCAALTEDAVEIAGTEGECDPAKANLYLYSATGLVLINLLPETVKGTPGAAIAAQGGAISADGSRIFFTDGGNLYLRNGDETVQVDIARGGGGTFQTASDDGSVSFFSKAGHLYEFVAAGKTVTDLTPGGEFDGMLGASPDGAYAYFQTAAGIFQDHAGALTPVSGPAAASNYPPVTGTARVSADGKVLAFLSSTDLTEFNANGASEVFVFSVGGGLTCVSCNPSGEVPTGPSTIPGALANGDAFRAYKPRALSDDGSRIFFDSEDSLLTLDTNRHGDVYQWETNGTGSCVKAGGCLNLISSGDEATASFLDASASGDDAFFITDGSLFPTDPGSADVYDARAGGGFPVPETPIACSGDSCQALPPEPEDPTPGTIVEGLGNEPLRVVKFKPKKKKHKHSKAKKHRRHNHAAKSSIRSGGADK